MGASQAHLRWLQESMPSRRKRNNSDSDEEDTSTALTQDIHYYNYPGRLINWLENPGNFRTFQTYLMFQSVALAILYTWWQSQFQQF